MRLLLLTLICGILGAQQTAISPEAQPAAQQKAQEPVEDPGLTIPVTVEYIIAPVLVLDRNDSYVSGIRPEEFRLFDNDKEQNISVDVSYTPISLVILVQSSANVEGLLSQVNKIGNMIGPQVIGDAGEAAVIAYDHRIRTLQEFTSDSSKLTAAFKKITPGSQGARMVDAVAEGVRMLRTRPRDRRRIMLLVGETRDMGSENRGREVLVNLQMNNVIFYAVDMSRFITTLTAPPRVGRPDALPPAMRPLPPNMAATPNNVQQMYGTGGGRAEFLPLLLEIYRDTKAIFKANPVEVFTKGTGGSEFGFRSQRTLEAALVEIGEQLHSQYMISYSPNNRESGGFHEIRVEVAGHPEVSKIVTRPGYWLGAKMN